ncbi:MAG: hypothetical protein M1827_001992 [Pycnora praestabilis]|nr:MAG: hypothetical protein M1827_001992 [Pycnora praestabilis]
MIPRFVPSFNRDSTYSSLPCSHDSAEELLLSPSSPSSSSSASSSAAAAAAAAVQPPTTTATTTATTPVSPPPPTAPEYKFSIRTGTKIFEPPTKSNLRSRFSALIGRKAKSPFPKGAPFVQPYDAKHKKYQERYDALLGSQHFRERQQRMEEYQRKCDEKEVAEMRERVKERREVERKRGMGRSRLRWDLTA